MKINRRQFTLGSTTLLLSGMLPLKVNSSMLDNKKNLVIIMLRGAMDGLTSVPYIHDNTLEKVRPDIVVKKLLDLKNTIISRLLKNLEKPVAILEHLWDCLLYTSDAADE